VLAWTIGARGPAGDVRAKRMRGGPDAVRGGAPARPDPAAGFVTRRGAGAPVLDPVRVADAFETAASAIPEGRGIARTLSEVVEALVPDVADAAAVLVRTAGDRLRLQALAPREGPAAASGSPLRRAASRIARDVVPDGGRILALPAGWDPSTTPLSLDAQPDAASDVRAGVLGLPLRQERECVGALVLGLEGGRRYTPSEIRLLQALAGQLSLALEVRRLGEEVTAARRAKSDFLAVVNHELRTPLTAIVGYADLLEAGIPGPTTPKQRLQLGRIKESAWDLLELIEGILAYARYEGERPELSVRSTEPLELLSAAIRLVEGAATEKGLEIAVHANDDLAPFPTDPEKARRILFHLLSNAVKFTASGEVCVRVRSSPDWVSFSVIDTGSGIRPEQRSAIFEPFWQAERPEKRTAGGAGMGLPLAQRLTELLGGVMEMASEPGRGSTFTVRFPREGPRRHYL
jgi:signal transduction histidine kinase